MKKTSRLAGFFKKPFLERIQIVKEFADLSDEECKVLQQTEKKDIDIAQRISENVISLMSFPFSVATNFIINGKEHLVPMVTEEPSVVAAASNGAKLARSTGGFVAETDESIMCGQIILKTAQDIATAINIVNENKMYILETANQTNPILIQHGGGAQKLTVQSLETSRGTMLAINLYVDVKDAMGANIVNTMAEAVAKQLEKSVKTTACLRIVSNLATQRMTRVRATWAHNVIGAHVIEGILDAQAVAEADIYRAATHNKGIMNGMEAVALATANDARALNAGAHSFAALHGKYQPLTTYRKTPSGDLEGFLELPLAIGTVGGIINSHPLAKIALKILGITTAQELAAIMGSVGLAQNFAALKVLVTEGIQKGHLRLHNRNA